MNTRTPGTAVLAAPLALAACHHSSGDMPLNRRAERRK